MRMLVRGLLASGTALIAGCVGIGSAEFGQGIVYHLPRSLLTITVVQYTAEGRTWYQIGRPKKAGSAQTPVDVYDELGDIESVSIPDAGQRYVAKYNPSAMSDDRLCISRSPTGLLQDVNFASDDRTAEVVFNIARFIAGSIGGPRKTGITTDTNGKSALVVRAYTGRIDPLSNADRVSFNRAMQDTFGEDVELDFTRMFAIFKHNMAPLPVGCRFGEDCGPQAWTDRCTADGICYRTQLDVPIDLKLHGERVDVNYAKVINPYDIGAIGITRAALVHKISKFKFNDGVLIGAVIRKPSEVEGASLLPLNVIYAALVTPSSALSTAFSGSNSGKDAILSELEKNTQSLNDANTKISALEQGLSPSVGLDTMQTYNLSCSAQDETGSFVNLVTGVTGANK